jgi:hypothetical protein
MDLGEIGWGSMDWIVLVQDRDKWRAPLKVVMTSESLRFWTLSVTTMYIYLEYCITSYNFNR